jgi:DNA-binding transcriptional regulator YdaS (Cro superfamily)
MKPLDIAIKHVDGVSKLAALLGVGQSVVSNWRARDSVIDPLLCAEIERVTDGVVTRQMLRPDEWQTIWPELVTAKDRDLIEGTPIDGKLVREAQGPLRAVKVDTRKARE